MDVSEIAREFGKIGGRARAQSLSPEERSESAARAARAKWTKYFREHPEKRRRRNVRIRKAA